MSFLVRTRSGSFKLSDSLTLEEIYEFSKDNSIEDKLLPIEKVFDDLERIDLSDVEAKKLINGAYVKLKGENYKKGNIIRAYDDKGKFIGICEILPIKGSLLLKIKKKFG